MTGSKAYTVWLGRVPRPPPARRATSSTSPNRAAIFLHRLRPFGKSLSGDRGAARVETEGVSGLTTAGKGGEDEALDDAERELLAVVELEVDLCDSRPDPAGEEAGRAGGKE